MASLELSFASKEDSLSVRRFSVREAMSTLFEVSLVVRSPNEDIDLTTIVGKSASFSLARGLAHAHHDARRWSGVCSFMEQEQAEPTGLSTYNLRIVPSLWLLTQRRNHRVFQHLSAREIIGRLLDEWHIEATWHIHDDHHPKLQYRVQYGESDFDFVCRILEEAGISFFFSDNDGKGSKLVFSDAPHVGDGRAGGPVRYVDNPNQAAEREFVTKVRVSHEVRPTKVTVRDHDFRHKHDYKLAGEAKVASTEAHLEQFHYHPGAFLVEGHKGAETPVADDRGVARADERVGARHAEARLAAEHAHRSRIAFHTNALDLRPGGIFSIVNHPRADLDGDKRLLVTDLSIEGTHDGEWTAKGSAAFTAHPYRPARKAKKQRIHGVESAIVVGRKGEEIHTDEFGRVRVQFHWDREGAFDEHSSCWMRVSQGWAGGGFGMMAIPRVGQEVLVAFVGGDPDQPLVVGRVFNNTTRTPYKLPEHRTRSTWKSDSSPGSDGFNEIMFEDAKGAELVYVQAERDLEKLVKRDETITIGKNRATTVKEVDEAAIGVREAVHIKGTQTGREMVADRISLTTGEATITLEGPNITLEAAANIMLNAGASILANAGAAITINGAASITVASGGVASIAAAGGDLVLQGGPQIKLNPGGGGGGGHAPKVIAFGDVQMVVPPDVDMKANLHEARKHRRHHPKQARWLAEKTTVGGAWNFLKQDTRYEAFHHFHWGAVGRAMGLPKGALIRHAKKHHPRGEVEGDYVGQFVSLGCDYFDKVATRHLMPITPPAGPETPVAYGGYHGKP